MVKFSLEETENQNIKVEVFTDNISQINIWYWYAVY